MVEFTLLSRSFGWILGSDREDEKRGINGTRVDRNCVN